MARAESADGRRGGARRRASIRALKKKEPTREELGFTNYIYTSLSGSAAESCTNRANPGCKKGKKESAEAISCALPGLLPRPCIRQPQPEGARGSLSSRRRRRRRRGRRGSEYQTGILRRGRRRQNRTNPGVSLFLTRFDTEYILAEGSPRSLRKWGVVSRTPRASQTGCIYRHG